jgi:hypothetical protein
LSETGVEVGDRGPANAFNEILLISGVPLAYWVDYGFIKMDNQASWRVPIIFQCIFAFFSGGGMWLLPGRNSPDAQTGPIRHSLTQADTPRWYYAQNRFKEGDAILARLNDSPVDPDRVQQTRHEIMAAIEAEMEANSSLHWKQFVTMAIVDKSRMKILRRLSMCFWLPMVREWMGSSLIGYYTAYM